MTREEKFMMEAIALSRKGVANNEGGPFGCIIVKNDEIVGRGNNKVTSTNDPTAHAEVTAIRDACKNLGTFQLEDCEIYTSCEPCPMCLGAILWARLDRVWYAATQRQAAAAGFDDSLFYRQMSLPPGQRIIPMACALSACANEPFLAWQEFSAKVPY